MYKRILVLLGVAGLLLVTWRFNDIRDWWWLRSYQPPAAVVALAQQTTMTPAGKRDFYLARPQIDPKPTFAANCPVTEKALVLGCYSKGRIYVLAVEKAELSKVMDVTAAHEMLHAAYNKLSAKERRRVNLLLDNYFASVTDQKLLNLITEYDKSEPGQRFNELHSIVGTQVKNLPPELEEYYQQYFSSRQTVLAAYEAYEGVFQSIEGQQAGLKSQLESLRTQLDNLQTRLDRQQAELQQTNRQLDVYQASGNITAYNSLVPVQNNQVYQYNNEVVRYKNLVEQYNQKVEQYNALALKQSDLVDSLDSSKYNQR